MNLEQIKCTSLELSKQLKEAGYKQEGLWDWYCQVGGIVCDTDVRGKWILRPASERHIGFGERLVAPTVAELGERLPKFVGSYKNKQDWTCRNIKDLVPKFFRASTEADARASCWLYLKKENLL